MPKKVLYFSNNTLLYGANRSLLGLVGNMSLDFHPIVVLPNKGPMYYELKKNGVQVLALPFYALAHKHKGNIVNKIKFGVRFMQYFLVNPLITLMLFICFRNKNISIIHTNTSVLDIGLNLSKMLKVKHVFHLREFQDLDYKLTRFISKKRFNTKLIESDKVISISKAIQKYYPVNSDVIYNGVVDQCDFIKGHYKRTNFIMCSTMVPGKSIEDGIEAYGNLINSEKLKDFKLLIFGDGEENYIDSLKELVKSLKLEGQVVFKGFSDNCIEHMRNASALLMCSKNEGLGRVTIEAMASKCLVIGYNGAGTRELIDNNNTGLLYDNREELIACMMNVIYNEDNMVSIVDSAYDFAMANFTISNYTKKIEEVYQELLLDA